MSRTNRQQWLSINFHRSHRSCYTLKNQLASNRKLRLECLEDRRVLTAVTVDTPLDVVDFNDGVTSLREAIFATNLVPGANEIDFSPALAGQPLVLTQGELPITDSLTITGLGATELTINASGNDPTPEENNGDGSRIFNIDDQNSAQLIDVTISGITFTGGDYRGGTFLGGGAIFNRENLILTDSVVQGNASDFGAGVAIAGAGNTVQILRTSFVENSEITSPNGQGGGLFFRLFGSADLLVQESTFSGNIAREGGGLHGSARDSSTVVITEGAFEGNQSRYLGGGRGGGLLIQSTDTSQVTITSSIFNDNRADRGEENFFGPGSGGGIYAKASEQSTLTISGNSLARNISPEGGALYLGSSQQATVIADNNNISNNQGDYGGGINAVSGSEIPLVITGNTISDNTGSTGGGIYALEGFESSLEIRDSTISGNTSGDGGGIYFYAGGSSSSQSIIENNIVSGNHATTVGGGISFRAFGFSRVQPTLRRNAIVDNRSDYLGGGLAIVAANNGGIAIQETTVTGNQAEIGGGIYSSIRDQVNLLIEGTTISENLATRGAGLNTLTAGASRSLIRNSTISGNQALQQGGGLYAKQELYSYDPAISGGLHIAHSTITDNDSGTEAESGSVGGGIFTTGDPVDVDHTIVAGNRGSGGSTSDIAGVFNSRFSLISFGADFLGPLADNGGPTQTHALLSGSPAIDAGDANLLEPPLFDQRGAPFQRIVGQRIDIGAFEAVPLVVNALGDSDDNDPYNQTMTLREAVHLANRISGAETITFASNLRNESIVLDSELVLTDATTIDGSGASQLAVAGNGNSRLFQIDDPDREAEDYSVKFADLILRDGLTSGDNVELETTFSGGAVRSVTSGELHFERVVLENNATHGALANGGAIYAQGPLTLLRTTVSGNSTSGSAAAGGGIATGDGPLRVIESTIASNFTTHEHLAYGGGVFARGPSEFLRSTIWGNHTSGVGAEGGGLNLAGPALLSNVTISGNFTTGRFAGGGGLAYRDDLTLLNSTIYDNHAQNSVAIVGGLLKVPGNEGAATTLVSSIIAGNTHGVAGTAPTNSPDLLFPTENFSASHNLIGISDTFPTEAGPGNLVGTFANPQDPLLQPLSDNGGTTLTHAPGAGSPVIDAGQLPPNTGDPAAQFDQRGAPFARLFGQGVDIGSYETELFIVNSLSDVDDQDSSNKDWTLREAIRRSNEVPGPGLIQFDPTIIVPSGIIALESQLPRIEDSLTVSGPGAELLTIDGGHGTDNLPATGDGFRLLDVDDGDRRTTSQVTISGITLTGGDLGEGGGGAIRSNESLVVANSVLSHNATNDESNAPGGAIQAFGTLTILDSKISENSTQGRNSAGGALSAFNAEVLIRNSTIADNRTSGLESPGGGIYTVGQLDLENSAVHGNSTGGESAPGGGIFVRTRDFGPTSRIVNSTISGNTASPSSLGGGFYLAEGLASVESSTITNNHAGYHGGVSHGDRFSIGLSFRNSIVAGNTDAFGPDDVNFAAEPNAFPSSLGYNLFGVAVVTTDPAGTDIILGESHPLLGPLSDNGGPTLTHAPLPGSPALEAGDPGVLELFDQRGQPFNRISGQTDIGAYESQIQPVADFNQDEQVDGSDFLTWQRGLGMADAQLADGNANDDGDVDAGDLAAWQVSFGASALTSEISASLAVLGFSTGEQLTTLARAVEAQAMPQSQTDKASAKELAFAELGTSILSYFNSDSRLPVAGSELQKNQPSRASRDPVKLSTRTFRELINPLQPKLFDWLT